MDQLPHTPAAPLTTSRPPSAAAPAAAGNTSTTKPRGGANHVTHGLRGSGLPKGAQRVGRRLNEFRRSLCEAVEERADKIDLHAAATIDSACQWQRHALLAARWLRLQHDELSPDQRLAFSREVAKASSERDRCIRLLGLDARASKDPWAVFDAQRAQEAVEAASQAANAGESQPEAPAAISAAGATAGRDAHIPLPAMPFEGQL